MTEEPRPRSTTGDLLHLIEQLAGFDRVGVTRLARHLGVPAPTVATPSTGRSSTSACGAWRPPVLGVW